MGFYDSKGVWRNDGEGFYDAKGYFRSPGEGFYDARGYFRSPGEGFYDAKGNWVNPGSSFYDSRGYVRSGSTAGVANAEEGSGTILAIGIILFIPIALIWMLTTFIVEWVAAHMYIIFIGYLIVDAFICLAVAKVKKHRGINSALSFIGNYICILSFIYIALIYAVPYVIANEGSFESFFEFTIVLALGVGGIAVIQFLNFYHENAILELVLGILFFVVVMVMLRSGTSEMSMSINLCEMYHIKSRTLFNVLFGFAIKG